MSDLNLRKVFIVRLLQDSVQAIRSTYPNTWRIYIMLFEALGVWLSIHLVSNEVRITESLAFGIGSILGIYVSLSISILVQVHSQSGKHKSHHEVQIKESQGNWPTQISICEKIHDLKKQALQNIFHLVVATVVICSLLITSVFYAAYFTDFRDASLAVIGLAGANLAFAYYVLLRNIYFLFSDDLKGEE